MYCNSPHTYAGLWAPWEQWADLVPHSDLCPYYTPSAPHPPTSTPTLAISPFKPNTLFPLYCHISLFLSSLLFTNRFFFFSWWSTCRLCSRPLETSRRNLFNLFLLALTRYLLFWGGFLLLWSPHPHPPPPPLPFPTVSTASVINNASQRIKNISRVLGAVGGGEEQGEGGKERVAPFSINVMENDVI